MSLYRGSENTWDIPLPTNKLAERLTLAGLEEASLTRVGEWWEADAIVVGQVLAVAPHPDADRLVLVDVAHEPGPNPSHQTPQRVVTGAPNLFQFKDRSISAGDIPGSQSCICPRGRAP